jgi:hypothetical protein
VVQSSASTVQEYLDQLPEDRRAIIAAVRDVILRNLPDGYRETMNWGMISYEIPLERYPDTYNRQPLNYIGLASQKNYCALYLMCVYGDPDREALLADGFAQAGKKLDMGKSCVRFHKLDDLSLETIGKVIAGITPDDYIRRYETIRQQTASSPRRKPK